MDRLRLTKRTLRWASEGVAVVEYSLQIHRQVGSILNENKHDIANIYDAIRGLVSGRQYKIIKYVDLGYRPGGFEQNETDSYINGLYLGENAM